MKYHFIHKTIFAFSVIIFSLFPSGSPFVHTAFAGQDGFSAVGTPSELSGEASERQQPVPSCRHGTLNGLTFSNPWADYQITFPEGTYMNPDSLVSYMSAYTGLDFEFAASLYGDRSIYPCINITFQDALIPLKECVGNLLDLYEERSYSYEIKTGIWLGGHPFTHVKAWGENTDIYIDNYLRMIDDKLMWICIKCPKNDAAAEKAVTDVLDSICPCSQN